MTKLSTYARRSLTGAEMAKWLSAETAPLAHFQAIATDFLFGDKPPSYVFGDGERRAINELARRLQARINTRH